MAKFACIGSRDIDRTTRENCEKLGFWIATCGGEVHSGNADGADQAFARGANKVNPRAVFLHLPWRSYNQEAIAEGNHICAGIDAQTASAICQRLHPKWQYLSGPVQALHRRNVSIIMPNLNDWVDMCIATPSQKKAWGGGTAMGMRIAEYERIEVVNINHWTAPMLSELCFRIRRICEGGK